MLNQYFDISTRIGKEITQQEYDSYVSDKRVFLTKANLFAWEAEAQFGNNSYPFQGQYIGQLLTQNSEDWDEAERIAAMRGFGETDYEIRLVIDANV